MQGAAMVASIFRDHVTSRLSGPAGCELGTMNADGTLTPDSWSGDSFAPPGAGGGVRLEYAISKALTTGAGEPGLVGGPNVHTHPRYTPQPGDQVLLVWLDHGTAAQRPYVLDVAG
jgi:hypothetical protein